MIIACDRCASGSPQGMAGDTESDLAWKRNLWVNSGERFRSWLSTPDYWERKSKNPRPYSVRPHEADNLFKPKNFGSYLICSVLLSLVCCMFVISLTTRMRISMFNLKKGGQTKFTFLYIFNHHRRHRTCRPRRYRNYHQCDHHRHHVCCLHCNICNLIQFKIISPCLMLCSMPLIKWPELIV